jgi:hypothetical protein
LAPTDPDTPGEKEKIEEIRKPTRPPDLSISATPAKQPELNGKSPPLVVWCAVAAIGARLRVRRN